MILRFSLPIIVLCATLLTTNAQDSRKELWDAYAESKSDTETAKELGELPERWEEIFAKAKDGKVPLKARTLTLGEHKMPFALILREKKGAAGKEGYKRPLFICMHGGGQNKKTESAHGWSINSREWQSQIGLAAQVYPAAGLFFVPRMADDRLGRWWHKHNQEAFDLVIETRPARVGRRSKPRLHPRYLRRRVWHGHPCAIHGRSLRWRQRDGRWGRQRCAGRESP